MPAPQKIIDLVENFDRNIEQLKRAQNETQVRVEFIDPMFGKFGLGWDMDNSIGAARQYQDVIHEDELKIGGTSKAPDYGFRIGGTLKFFVEAKKPSVHLKEDSAPAYQVRNYGWNKKLSICVLTDFEEFAIYDCTVKPKPTDKPSVARVDYFTYKDYTNKWDEIAGIFSKDSVIKGNFDKFAAGSKGKRGTTTVDKDILLTIEHWREILAKNIAKNNKISEEELKFATQRILDRIIFLRICEARAIEQDESLLRAVQSNNSYKNLFTLFQAADNRYNSGLFYFRKGDKAHKSDSELDTITPNLKLDDKVIKEIIENLYYPKSQYLFDVIPADILGQVYEQFLGKVIRMTPGGLVKIEEKPEVRKAGGVYYTPTYIVDYIVKNTVGKMLEKKQMKNLTLNILDPACGSGSFLLGAYNYLLNWYLHEYSQVAKKLLAQKNSPIYEVGNDTYRLTTPERKRILLEHIYGVDIDEQAVEVAKLNLMLKCLEGEAGTNLKLSVERILPDLSDNIKCGNSLIGPDFSDGLFSGDDKKINPFDWNAEFADIMKQGGFDVVIGNPPYGMIEDETQKSYLLNQYSVPEGRYDTFELFIEKGTKLLKQSSLFGFIIPSPFLTNIYSRKLRRYLLKETSIVDITNFGLAVFQDPTVHTSILILKKGFEKNNQTSIRKKVIDSTKLSEKHDYRIDQTKLGENEYTVFDIFNDPTTSKIFDKISEHAKPLGEICFLRQCIKTGDDPTYVKKNENLMPSPWKATLRGKGIQRYQLVEDDIYLKYGDWLARNWKNRTFYETPKIAIRETGNRITATLDLDNRYFLSSLYAVYPKDKFSIEFLKYLLAILNSRLATYYIKIIAFELTSGAFTKIRTNQLARLPIHSIMTQDVEDKKAYDKLVSSVDRMLELNKELPKTKTPNEKTRIERLISATDSEIDKLVYELYGLSEEEIKVVVGE